MEFAGNEERFLWRLAPIRLLVGTAFILELERPHRAPLNVERVTAALVGGFVGWLWHIAFRVDLIRLVVPKEPPHNLHQALMTALLIGLLSGSALIVLAVALLRAVATTASSAVGGCGGLCVPFRRSWSRPAPARASPSCWICFSAVEITLW